MKLVYMTVCLTVWICVWKGCQSNHDQPYNLYGYEDPSQNLIKNWDFEDDFAEDQSDWYAENADVKFVTDAYTGVRSARVLNIVEGQRYSGVFQKVQNIKSNTLYYLSAFVKPTRNPGTGLYFEMRLSMSYRTTAGTVRIQVARMPFLRKNDLWRQIGGDFTTGNDVIEDLRFEVEVSKSDVQYYIDTVSLVEIAWDPHWKIRARADIDKYRKNRITLKTSVPTDTVPYCKMKIELVQTKRHFGWGSAIRADPFKEPEQFSIDYRKFFFDNFDVAVFENAMKWKVMEPKEGNSRVGKVDDCMAFLKAQNVSVRGHCVLWSILEANPDWVLSLTGEELKAEVYKRIDFIVEYYKGQLTQWDVVNENLHGKFYSSRIGDANFVDKVHQRVRKIDPDVELCLNDYQALRSGDYTSALADQAYDLMSRDVPLDCIGIQTHLRAVPVEPQVIKKRLEICTRTGLPVVLTEVSIHTTDVKLRAWQLEVLYTMAFANPNVTGILLWQFSDNEKLQFESDETALFNGADYDPNEAGAVLVKLLKSWRTKGTITPKNRVVKEQFQAFHGAYRADIYYKKTLVKSEAFYLHPGQDITVNIPVSRADIKDAIDGDTTICNPLDDDGDDTDDDDDDPTKPTNKGSGFSRASKKKKSAKVNKLDPVTGTNKD